MRVFEFEHEPAPAERGRRIAPLDRRAQRAVPTGIPRLPRNGDPLPASPAQEALWLVDRLQLGGAYHLGAVVGLGDRVAPELLRRALVSAVGRHEVLRTRFEERDGRPLQRIGPARPRCLPVVDLAALPRGLRERATALLIENASAHPFDLVRPAGGGLLRAVLLRLGGGRSPGAREGGHLLLLCLHQVVCDEASLAILVREIVSRWRAALEGRIPEIPPLQVQYADFAAWQTERLNGGLLDAGLGRCRERLAGSPADLGLPTDHPRSAGHGGAARRLPAAIDPTLVESLRRLARAEGATLLMVLAAALQAVLGRQSGRDDVLVGTPVTNRLRPELEPLVGQFSNLLVLRGRLGGDPTFRRLLARSRQDYLAALVDREVPFERLVGHLRPARQAGRNPLVQVVLGFREPHWSTVNSDEPAIGIAQLPPRRAKLDLTLEVEDRGDFLAGALEYRGDLFDETTVRRLWVGVGRLLEAATAEPERPLTSFDLLSPEERQAVLVEWSDTAREEPETASLAALFEEQATRGAEAVAVVEGSFHRTYGSLARRASDLALRLLERGVSRGSPVGLLLDRSEDAVLGILGILAAGGAYVPLDPGTPAPRLRTLAGEIGLEWALVDDRSAPVAAETGLRALPVKPRSSERDAARTVAWASPLGAELAYVLFTSGSTGRPKAVGAPHRGVLRLIRDPSFATLGPCETQLQLAPLAFDGSTFEIWGALARGGRLVIAPGGPRSLSEVADLVSRERVTLLWLTSGLFHQMVDSEGAALTGVRQLLAGGDILSPGHVARHLERALPGSVLIDGYGPTEATVGTSCHRMAAGERPGAPVPIGRPIPETRVAVADAVLRPVPLGAAGELVIAGPGLARGYLGHPAATAAAFVPDPWPQGSDGVGGRLYRSGDLVRFSAGGHLVFLGRLDRQVKVRGFRVEPGEIELALQGHPGVAQAVVVLDRGVAAAGTARDRMVAYWVPKPGGLRPSASELRRFLEGRLPRPLVPAVFVLLETLPLTRIGKVDRSALPPPGAGTGNGTAARPAKARSSVEARVLDLWGEVLGVVPRGLDEDFFELGGHSFDAVRLLAKARRALGVSLPLATFFEAPTPGALAAEVEAAAPAGEEAPLSFAQERLWFIDRLTGGSAAYNVPVAVVLSGRVDLMALAGALRAIQARHEALRTRFAERAGKAVQVVAPAVPFPVPLVDLGALPGAAARGEGERLAAAETWEPFDLDRGPVWRCRLVRLGPDEHVILVTLHHIVSDGWSAGVLMQEVAAGYRARTAGSRGKRLPPIPIQYPEFARRQRQELQGEDLDRLLAYWRDRLTGAAAVLDLPADHPRPRVQDFRGATIRFRIPASTTDRLLGWGRARRVTPFMTLLAAFQVLLARWTGQDDFVVGTPIANRPKAELEKLIGFFVNTLALRSDLTDEPAFDELVARVRHDLLDAYQHQDLPFERLVEELAPRRELSRQPVVQAVFALQNVPVTRLDLSGATLAPLASSSGDLAARFDLTMSLVEEEGGISGTIVYPRALFDGTTMRRLAEHYRRILEAVAADPDRPIDDLSMLPVAERHLVAIEWPEAARLPTATGTGGRVLVVDRRLRPLPVGVWGEVITDGEGGRGRVRTGSRGRFRADGRLERLDPATAGEVEPCGVLGLEAVPREQSADLAAPRSPLEESLVGIWSEILGRERVGIQDDFFDLGGHSLLATQVVAQIRDRLGIEVPLEDFFEAPTVADLAERVVRREAEQAEDQALDEVLAELDHLAEDEVEDLLREEAHGDGG